MSLEPRSRRVAALQCVRSYVDPAGAASGPNPTFVVGAAKVGFDAGFDNCCNCHECLLHRYL
jgi:hypothetical protein